MISLRQITQSSLHSIAAALHRAGVSPNALTYLSLVLALACGMAVTAAAFYTASCLLALSGVCDLLDGELARRTGRCTSFGALLDSTIDRVSDAAPLLGLIVLYSASGLKSAVWIPALAMLAAGLVSYIRARAESLDLLLPRLWMRRGERIALICGSLLFGSVAIKIRGIALPMLLLGIALLALLSTLGAVSAMLASKKAFDGRQDLQPPMKKLEDDTNQLGTSNEDRAKLKANPTLRRVPQQIRNPVQTMAER
jgi:CDP-diacylglycerol---glycerol-3-phosphate 3-phosphatidyltransferase